jgi:hypothetical protein
MFIISSKHANCKHFKWLCHRINSEEGFESQTFYLSLILELCSMEEMHQR